MKVIAEFDVRVGSKVTKQGVVLEDGRFYSLRGEEELNGIDPDREVLMVFCGYAYFGLTDGKVDSKGLIHLIYKKYHVDDRHSIASLDGWQYADEVVSFTSLQ